MSNNLLKEKLNKCLINCLRQSVLQGTGQDLKLSKILFLSNMGILGKEISIIYRLVVKRVLAVENTIPESKRI